MATEDKETNVATKRTMEEFMATMVGKCKTGDERESSAAFIMHVMGISLSSVNSKFSERNCLI